MDLFKRKPKINVITDVETFEKGDRNFYEALLGEISSGSHDVKETIFYFPDRQVHVRSAKGLIKSIFDTSENLPLESRFYWTKDSGIDETDLHRLSNMTPHEVFNAYSSFVKTFPNSKEFLSSVLEAYVVSVIQKTVSDFDSHEKVRSEIINDNKTAKLVGELDFFDYAVESIESNVEKLAGIEHSTLNLLSVSGFKPSEVTLSVENKDYNPVTDAERFVFTAAESKANLEEVKGLSGGFIWIEVLETLLTLSESLSVKVSFPGSDAALPDIEDLVSADSVANDLDPNYHEIENPFEDDEELEDKTSVLTAAPLEGIIVEMVNSPGEEFIFGSMVEEDDGSFMYEMLHDDKLNFFTEGVSDNIEDDVRKILSHETISDRVKDEVILYLRKNTTLEAELSSIEKSIADSRGRYNENVEVFEELRLQNNAVTSLDDSEVGREKFNEVSAIIEKQDISNSSFFTVSKLEEDRYKINVERRVILKKLSFLISEMFGEGVQGILHRIDLKLQGIKQVTNIAFHAPEDDEDEHVDPAFLTDFTSEIIAAKSKEFTFTETPTFFILADERGFNPFEIIPTS